MTDKTGDFPFDPLQARLLPVADVVMVLMWSRPASGTLRTTMVTMSTIGLAIGVAATSLVLAALGVLLALSGTTIWLVAALALLVVALACADLAVYGARQRLLIRRAA